mmetsp:Transcript_26754/g.50963  ORF Transcript_26754/g.50963 Transcript_26754/m.50963 type:complete len:493 (+) Transcript_26754:416-1894(+)
MVPRELQGTNDEELASFNRTQDLLQSQAMFTGLVVCGGGYCSKNGFLSVRNATSASSPAPVAPPTWSCNCTLHWCSLAVLRLELGLCESSLSRYSVLVFQFKYGTWSWSDTMSAASSRGLIENLIPAAAPCACSRTPDPPEPDNLHRGDAVLGVALLATVPSSSSLSVRPLFSCTTSSPPKGDLVISARANARARASSAALWDPCSDTPVTGGRPQMLPASEISASSASSKKSSSFSSGPSDSALFLTTPVCCPTLSLSSSKSSSSKLIRLLDTCGGRRSNMCSGSGAGSVWFEALRAASSWDDTASSSGSTNHLDGDAALCASSSSSSASSSCDAVPGPLDSHSALSGGSASTDGSGAWGCSGAGSGGVFMPLSNQLVNEKFVRLAPHEPNGFNGGSSSTSSIFGGSGMASCATVSSALPMNAGGSRSVNCRLWDRRSSRWSASSEFMLARRDGAPRLEGRCGTSPSRPEECTRPPPRGEVVRARASWWLW